MMNPEIKIFLHLEHFRLLMRCIFASEEDFFLKPILIFLNWASDSRDLLHF